MDKVLASIKKLIYNTGLSPALDQFIYRYRRNRHQKENDAYRQAHPDEKIPPDYYLYETFQIHYRNFFEQGDLTARELFEWTAPYFKPSQPLRILEWGCGVARVCRYLDRYFPNAELSGCDINPAMVQWDRENIRNVSFSLIDYNPPTGYPDASFDFVYGLSVFTHIEDPEQEKWLAEIHRILKDNGVFLFSTHGTKYEKQLTSAELKTLQERGAVTKHYFQKGHRLMGTYNRAEHFKKIIESYFEVLEYYDGTANPHKLGGQDLWIVRKRPDIQK